MDKKTIIATLIQYAEQLDFLGLPGESDEITNIASSIGQNYHFPEENIQSGGIDDSILRGDEWNQQQEDLEDISGEEGFIPDEDRVIDFEELLADSGADINRPDDIFFDQ